jgi:spore coat protein CotH
MVCGLFLAVSGCAALKNEGKKLLRGHLDPAMVDTGLPVITISTHNGRPITSKEVYLDADIEIRDPSVSSHNLKTKVQIRGRGNTTWNAPKKPYRLKFAKKTSLFGYEKAKSWVLLANYQDTTLMLNSLAFELGRRFGLDFTPQYTHVEVVVNGTYEGSYLLTEQVGVGPGRVAINEDQGFLVELDDHYDEEPKFRTPHLSLPVMIKHPEDLTEDSGYDFVKKALDDMEAALFSDTFPDNQYRDLIDLESFINYIMINEITRNGDLHLPHSVFLYQDQGSKIGLGPLWDFDYGFDYDEGTYFTHTTGMFYNTAFHTGSGQRFFSRFFEDPEFRKAYQQRWNEIYPEIANMEPFINTMASYLEKSYQANAQVWWWNKVDYPQEILRLKGWWRDRIAYLHREINSF